MNEDNIGMETYLTIEEVAAYLKLAQQTIRKYVLNKSIPYRKVQKSVRFRLSEIEQWIDEGGGNCPINPVDEKENDLFAGMEAGTAAGGEGDTGRTEIKAGRETGKTREVKA
jgi:excisionase family DNA binding protein